MELRWYVNVRKVTNWSDRKDEWETIVYPDPPVLQMLINNEWVTVPTVRGEPK